MQAAIESEPKHLASLRPLAGDAIEILSGVQSDQSIEDLKYIISEIQKFVMRWRPSPEPNSAVLYIQPLWARSTDDQAGEALRIIENLPPAGQLESAQISDERELSAMKIFISHSSIDKKTAESLVGLIRNSLGLSSRDIRCTSVDGYRLSAGADSNEQLRAEVFGCDAFVALLSPNSIKSIYVTFELGARWGTKKHLAPIMIGGISPSDLRPPLSGIHAINGASESEVHQLIYDLANHLNLSTEGPAVYSRSLKSFIEHASLSSGS
ncbi:MAG: toll/interleukin-1 receptor domain-containing protein [Pseudomonadota bacterium]